MNEESEDMICLTADFLNKQADILIEKLKNAKTQKEKNILIDQLIKLRDRIAYEIRNIDKIIDEDEENS